MSFDWITTSAATKANRKFTQMLPTGFKMISVAALGFAAAMPSLASAQVTYRVVAASGQHVPGFAPGVVFSTLQSATINNPGRVAFVGTMAGPGIGTGTEAGLWVETSSDLGLVARTGDVAPGARNGRSYNGGFGLAALNDLGTLMFVPGLSGLSEGVWSGRVGGVAPVAQSDDLAPGGGTGAVFGAGLFRTPWVGRPPVMAGADIAFSGFMIAPGWASASSGIWKKPFFGDLALIAKEGQAAPGTAPGVVFARPPLAGEAGAFGAVVINDGTVCFIAIARNVSIPTTNISIGIWRAGPFGLQLVAYRGDPVSGPGMGGTAYAAIGIPSLNAAGRVAFSASVTGVGVTTANDTVIMSDRSGVLMQAEVREGDPAPIPGVALGNVGAPLINRYGRLVFACGLTGMGVDATNDSAICTDREGDRRLVAREGQGAPGTTALFASMGAFYSMNASGQVLLEATLTGPGVTTANDLGIWATDTRGGLHLIAREGDMLDINPEPTVTDLRTIAGIWSYRPLSSGGEDGLPRSLSDDGRVAFQVSFTDQTSAVFVATIPAPAPCVADFDDGSGTGTPDGGVTIDDLLYYLSVFAVGTVRADLDDGSGTGTPDGGVGIEDLLYYLARFDAGC